MTETKPIRAKADDNVVFVGKKPTMSYVLAVLTQFDNNKEVHVKARGRSISTAVDVVEAVKNKFVRDAKSQVAIGTEQVEDETGRKLNVSTIDITLTK
ncbi:MAG: DNA-binding protein Alba [Candidatus Aenigmarchaeota archaeon]|nr:DNA-binding protein Alba [Candidatus Aenigmarchaeota archaeon]